MKTTERQYAEHNKVRLDTLPGGSCFMRGDRTQPKHRDVIHIASQDDGVGDRLCMDTSDGSIDTIPRNHLVIPLITELVWERDTYRTGERERE